MNLRKKNQSIKICGGILSGGESSRMGQAKDSILFANGRTMLETVLLALFEIFDQVIVAGKMQELNIAKKDRVSFIGDNYKDSGPLAGIEAILASGMAEAYLIVACDQPLINSKIYLKLLKNESDMPCFFEIQDKPFIQPLPGYFPVNWLPEIREALNQKKKSIKSLIKDSDIILETTLNESERNLLFSINTPEELENAKSKLDI